MPAKTDTEKNIAPEIAAKAAWRLTHVKPLPGYKLEVTFNDGTHGFVDMVALIMSKNAGVFSTLKNVDLFNKVYLVYGAVTWPGDIDLSPDAMHDAIKENGTWVVKG